MTEISRLFPAASPCPQRIFCLPSLQHLHTVILASDPVPLPFSESESLFDLLQLLPAMIFLVITTPGAILIAYASLVVISSVTQDAKEPLAIARVVFHHSFVRLSHPGP